MFYAKSQKRVRKSNALIEAHFAVDERHQAGAQLRIQGIVEEFKGVGVDDGIAGLNS